MFRVAVCLSLLMIGLAGSVAAIRVLVPQNTPPSVPLQALDPGACQMPCWQGIRPGITTMKEAVRLLLASPYIDPKSIQPAYNEGIAFTACWKQPDQLMRSVVVDITDLCILIENRPGEELVNTILLNTTIPFGEFVMHFGPPGRYVVGRVSGRDLFYVLEYPQLGMQYDAFTECHNAAHTLTVTGRTYVLQPIDHYVAQTGWEVITQWRGFGSRATRNLAMRLRC